MLRLSPSDAAGEATPRSTRSSSRAIAARARRDFAEADRIRAELAALGVTVPLRMHGKSRAGPESPGPVLVACAVDPRIAQRAAMGLDVSEPADRQRDGGNGNAGGPGVPVTVSLTANLHLLTPLIARFFIGVVNNAGIQHVSPIEDFPVEKWDAVLAINLSSAFHAIRAVTPGMKQRGWGRILTTASAHSQVASPFKSAYVAAKHGIVELTKTVALELARSKITCNCISPGYVWTPLVEKQIPNTMKARNMSRDQVINDVLLAAQPTKEFVTVEQVASLALFLCGEGAAQITGANLSIDGGWTAA